MAERGKRLDEMTQKRIRRLAAYTPIKQIAKTVEVSKNTVRKYVRAISSSAQGQGT